MSRAIKEWIADHDDQAIPPRVRLRIWIRANGICQICTRRIFGEIPQYDHVIALINGGGHRENNIQLVCFTCHTSKSRDDVAEKSMIYHKRLKHIGIKKTSSRPMPGTKASGLKKRMDGTVERR